MRGHPLIEITSALRLYILTEVIKHSFDTFHHNNPSSIAETETQYFQGSVSLYNEIDCLGTYRYIFWLYHPCHFFNLKGKELYSALGTSIA